MFPRFRLVLLTAVLLLPIGAEVFVGGRSQPAVAQSVDSRKAEGDRLLAQGFKQFQVNQFEAALRSWQQALTIDRAINDRPVTGSNYPLHSSNRRSGWSNSALR